MSTRHSPSKTYLIQPHAQHKPCPPAMEARQKPWLDSEGASFNFLEMKSKLISTGRIPLANHAEFPYNSQSD